MGPQDLYLNKWSPHFDQTQDVPSAVPVWVRLPHLPLHCWNSDSLEAIGNKIGNYIDKAEKTDQYSCARICVEVDLDIGFPETINLIVVEWSYIRNLDYKKIPLRCYNCESPGHLQISCPYGKPSNKVGGTHLLMIP